MVTDPVCKMQLESDEAIAKTEYAGTTYYFCSEQCKSAFATEPQKYANSSPSHGHSCCKGH